MAFVSVAPDMVAAAAGNLESIGAALSQANAAAASPTVGLAAPAADQVSAAVAAMFGTHAQEFQSISAQMAAVHDQIVGTLKSGAAAYAGAEAANVQQILSNAVTAPAQALLGQPLARTGAAAAVDYGFTGGAAMMPIGGGGAVLSGAGLPISVPVVNTNTPFGPLVLTLNGQITPTGPMFDSGSLVAPAPLVLGVNAVGPAITTMSALHNSHTAFANAVHTGNPLAAAGALLTAPGNAVQGFLFGQTAISQSIPLSSDTGYTSAGISVPVGGLLAPVQPVTVTLTPTAGTPTVISLSGPKFGGLIPALLAGV
ncbi:PE family protein [Mycobacterium shinjukuense]|uniref:PE family protein n=1 Tax=Mycobacterium shinjukuense TaxID=398694 RepID=A0A7I7MPB3_9MYCO|nr:PE family protein [Mycobacterium shinjukuense]MCV6985772.1 PE family protein [Mycobacterium shinjukuense]ORB71817.1 PE family protein [Mycobacterium shinjukuense]BBX73652.1 PE family protein [Mycobacterium shinjukuense]